MFIQAIIDCATVGIMSLGIIVGAAVAYLIWQTNWHDERAKLWAEARAGAHKEYENANAELDHEAAELEQEQSKFMAWRSKEIGRLQQADQALQRKRSQIEAEERRISKAIHAASVMAGELPAMNGQEVLSAKLRELHLQGCQIGKFLTVQIVGTVDGFVRVRWAVQLERPHPPKVELLRDGTVIHTSWRFGGEHGDLLKPGRRYVYSFRVSDESGRSFGEEIVREVRVPGRQVLLSDVRSLVRPIDSDAEREARLRKTFVTHMRSLKVVREEIDAAIADIDRWRAPEETKLWAKARIEALAAALTDQGDER